MNFKALVKDIRFWIIVFFLIRLIGIFNPPLEVGHNWRQTTVTMVARNFLEVDNNILYPRIDIAGNLTGITGMEFPIFNYLIYLVSELFGYQHWYGRLINLVFSSFGIFFFYKLIKKHFSLNVALYSSIILLVSVWFQFSRKIMPDTFSMSLIISSIYFAGNYLESQKNSWPNLILYGILVCFGLLSKLPSGYLLIVLSIYIFNRNIEIQKKLIFCSLSIICIIPSLLWYFYWVPHLVEKYEYWHFFMGKDFITGFSEIVNNLPKVLKRFYDTALKFVGFICFSVGLFMAIKKRAQLLLTILALSFGSFLIIMFKSGYTFYHHNYYIIPFVPVMALFAGYALSLLKKSRWLVIILLAIISEGIINQQHDFIIKEKDNYLLNLEMDLDKISDKSDLILINSGYYPTAMYFAHRKGWIAQDKELVEEGYLSELKAKGLKYMVILNPSIDVQASLKLYKKVVTKEKYDIYKL